jgi:CDP-glycerol glycerophosphotransferase
MECGHAEAPGPLLCTINELAEAIRNVDELTIKYASMHDTFVSTHCPLEDGRATRRLVDRVFGA